MQNPESLQPSETEELNQLQNYNKQYINNEMAAETGNIQQTAFFFLIWVLLDEFLDSQFTLAN